MKRFTFFFSWRRQKFIIAIWVFLAVICIPFAIGLQSHLEAGGFTNPRGQATKAQQLAEQAFGEAPNDLLVILKSKEPVTSWVVPVEHVLDKLPDVSQVQSYLQHSDWMSRNHRMVLIEVGLNMGDTAAQNLVPKVTNSLDSALAHQGVTAIITGAPALNYSLNITSQQDAERAELLAFPILLIVLLMVFRSLTAVAIPLVMAGFSIDLASAVGFLVNKITPLTILYSNAISMIGLAVGIDYSLFIIKRFREELSSSSSIEEAAKNTMRTAGRSVLFSGLTVVAALAALLIPRITVFTTIGLGGMIVTIIAIAASMTLLPAVLQVLGGRINSGSIHWNGKANIAVKQHMGYKYPALITAIVLAGFFATFIPLFNMHLQVPVASASILPASDSARQGLDLVERDTGARDLFPVQVILEANKSNEGELLKAVSVTSRLAEKNRSVAGVISIATLAASHTDRQKLSLGKQSINTALYPRSLFSELGTRLLAQVVITTKSGPDSTAVHQLVRQLRQELPPVVGQGISVLVGGQTAQGIDFDNLVTSSLPIVIAFVLVMSAILLLIAFRSILLALFALAFNAMVSGAALGLLTLIEQHLNQQINSVTPLLVLAVMFGLSMDYMVIMTTRMRELFHSGYSHREAVLEGTKMTAGMVNGAALIMIGVFAAFGTAQVSVVQQLGIGLALAVALDTIVIRRILMPSVFLLTGSCIWGKERKSVLSSKNKRHGFIPAPGIMSTTQTIE